MISPGPISVELCDGLIQATIAGRPLRPSAIRAGRRFPGTAPRLPGAHQVRRHPSRDRAPFGRSHPSPARSAPFSARNFTKGVKPRLRRAVQGRLVRHGRRRSAPGWPVHHGRPRPPRARQRRHRRTRLGSVTILALMSAPASSSSRIVASTPSLVRLRPRVTRVAEFDARGSHQRRDAFLARQIDERLVLQQELDERRIAGPRGAQQGSRPLGQYRVAAAILRHIAIRRTALELKIRIGAGLEQHSWRRRAR